MCVIQAANAGELRIPSVSIANDAPYYDTEADAVQGAMALLRSLSAPWEYSGVIVKNDDGRYQVSSPVTIRDGARSALIIPKDLRAKLASTFHSHPAVGGVKSHELSADDKATLKKLGVPMYVLDKRSNRVITVNPQTN